MEPQNTLFAVRYSRWSPVAIRYSLFARTYGVGVSGEERRANSKRRTSGEQRMANGDWREGER